ncbi:hypothetical protein [Bradyrhizobium sp. UNPF46]|uniref:hypothetical protein n=1 Tax=Bradyrhizobium sp. UNPF46 TaxID=1141168 RepID=UPI0015F008CA|nr:hypothetical protein [Bradyrhizobium sp. UNPF46]
MSFAISASGFLDMNFPQSGLHNGGFRVTPRALFASKNKTAPDTAGGGLNQIGLVAGARLRGLWGLAVFHAALVAKIASLLSLALALGILAVLVHLFLDVAGAPSLILPSTLMMFSFYMGDNALADRPFRHRTDANLRGNLPAREC